VTINARVEEAAGKPMWRDAARRSRCLVPSLGWYEWKDQGGGRARLPFFIHCPQRELFHFAGLCSSWKSPGGEPILSFAILTFKAVERSGTIHDRMPRVLAPSAHDAWLDPALTDAAAAAELAAGAGWRTSRLIRSRLT
jgi:putative SOS response-associated peptidase YedK